MAAKQFNEHSKLGFMRLIQIYNVLMISACAVAMIFIRGGSVAIDFNVVSNVAIMLAQGAVIWLIANRKMYTRQIIIGIEVFEYVVGIFQSYASGSIDPGVAIISAIPNAIVILYFAFSPRAKAVLVQPWADETLMDIQEARARKLWDPKSGAFWMRLLIYFFIFSVVGHWMEMFVQLLVINGIFPGTIASPDSLTWRDNMNPFFIYGIAVVFCGLVLYPIYMYLREKLDKRWKAILVSFLVNTLFCVVAELILGFLFNADYSAWDYRDQFMNFQGQICLVYTLAFSIMASLITWFVYPIMERQFGKMRKDTFRIVFVVACVLYLFIYMTYNIDLDTLMPGSGLSVDL